MQNKVLNIIKATIIKLIVAFLFVAIVFSIYKVLLEEKFDLLKQKKEKLNNLFNKIHKIYPTISQSQIIPVIIGDSAKSASRAKLLQEQGFYVLPINPPTVPVNTSRLRISLTADIEFEEICNIFG